MIKIGILNFSYGLEVFSHKTYCILKITLYFVIFTYIKVVLDPLELFWGVNGVSSDLCIGFHFQIYSENKVLAWSSNDKEWSSGEGRVTTCSIDFSALSINSRNFVDLHKKKKSIEQIMFGCLSFWTIFSALSLDSPKRDCFLKMSWCLVVICNPRYKKINSLRPPHTPDIPFFILFKKVWNGSVIEYWIVNINFLADPIPTIYNIALTISAKFVFFPPLLWPNWKQEVALVSLKLESENRQIEKQGNKLLT